jgi:hypothetical protein
VLRVSTGLRIDADHREAGGRRIGRFGPLDQVLTAQRPLEDGPAGQGTWKRRVDAPLADESVEALKRR